MKSWLIGKDPDAGKDWRQEEKGMTEDEMVGWHHWLDGHEFEQALGVGDGKGSLVCYSSWGHKESDTIEWLNWTDLHFVFPPSPSLHWHGKDDYHTGPLSFCILKIVYPDKKKTARKKQHKLSFKTRVDFLDLRTIHESLSMVSLNAYFLLFFHNFHVLSLFCFVLFCLHLWLFALYKWLPYWH